MKTIRSLFSLNPIIVKELRSRMRGGRAFLTLTITLTLMAGILLGLMRLMTTLPDITIRSPQIGQVLFYSLFYLELFLVCTITPAVTAGAISSEKEKLTYEMLLATPLSPAKILWGKLISALSYVFIMIFAAVPLASIIFVFGGVTIREMIKGVLMLLVIAFVFGIIGLFLSAWLGRTGRATVVNFILVVVLFVTPVIFTIIYGLFGLRTELARSELPRWILSLSPSTMLAAAITPAVGGNDNTGVTSLFLALSGRLDGLISPVSATQIPRPVYHYSLLLYGILSIALFTAALALIHPAKRWYLPKKAVVASATTLVVFLLLCGGVFWVTAPRYEWFVTNNPPQTENAQGAIGRLVSQPVAVAVEARTIKVEVTEPAATTPQPTPTPTPVKE